MVQRAQCRVDGKFVRIADNVGDLIYHKVEVCLCEACEALYQMKDVGFMQWMVVHLGGKHHAKSVG